MNIFKVLIQENTIPGSVQDMTGRSPWCCGPIEKIVCQRLDSLVLQVFSEGFVKESVVLYLAAQFTKIYCHFAT